MAINSSAQDKSIYGFCFSQELSIAELRHYLQPIALPSDQLDMMGPCLEVLLSEGRSNLYEAFLQKRYRLMRTYRGSRPTSDQMKAVSEAENCRLEFLKKGLRTRKNDEFSLGKKSKLQRNEEKLSGETRSQLLLQKGHPGSLRMDEEEVFLTCNGGNNGNYLLIVALNSPDSQIRTTLNVTQGQSINIGSIVKDLSGKNRTLSTQTGIDYDKTKGQDNYEYFLTLH